MSSVLDLARPEIRELRPYRAAQYEDGLLRMNANETPWRPPGDQSARGLNRYPETRPLTLTNRLAEFYGVLPEQLLVTRGSSEAIDLLIRCFCTAGQDDIMICPPTFGMYAVYAQVQGAGIVEVPLIRADGFALDIEQIKTAWNERCKLLFVCSPNNPTGSRIATEQIDDLCNFIDGRGIVVLDAAYTEFAAQDPTVELLERHQNIAVLRTLSKALGLAGVRCGAVLGAVDVLDMLSCILPPYSCPTPSQDAALACLEPGQRDLLRSRAGILCAERERLTALLGDLPEVLQVWPSEANFILLEVRNPDGFVAAAKAGGVSIRDFSWDPYTKNCLRITVGDVEQNNQLMNALDHMEHKQ